MSKSKKISLLILVTILILLTLFVYDATTDNIGLNYQFKVLIHGEDKADWEVAKSNWWIGDWSSLEKYLENHPNGDFVNNANDLIFWCKSRKEGSVYALERYLLKYPNGEKASWTRKELDDIAWEKAKKINTRNSYKNYIDKNRYGTHIEEAEWNINKLSASTVNQNKSQPNKANKRIQTNPQEQHESSKPSFPKILSGIWGGDVDVWSAQDADLISFDNHDDIIIRHNGHSIEIKIPIELWDDKMDWYVFSGTYSNGELKVSGEYNARCIDPYGCFGILQEEYNLEINAVAEYSQMNDTRHLVGTIEGDVWVTWESRAKRENNLTYEKLLGFFHIND